ncbi:MAG TPA: hypothetical protein VLJ61_10130 [Pyrinomonadaceae bacterium]|nr:hypothetical protein [Pyrinomonadaceae bacterium]
MKNVSRLLLMAALAAVFALPAFAQDTAAGGGAAAQCTAEADAKAALYKKFLDNYKGTPPQQKTASDTGHEYLTKYGNCPDDADKKIATFIQNWVSKYDVAARNFACTDAVAQKDYAKAFEACHVILSAEPDNLDTMLLLAVAGLNNAASPNSNKSLNADALAVARHAAELIESGKSPTKWDPFANRDEALGFLYYTQGVELFDSSPTDAAAAFQKAAQSNSKYKREPSTYTYLGTIYERNELAKLVEDYKAAFPPGVPIPDEKKPQYQQMLDQIGKVQARIVDAYARAASYMNADPKADATRKKAVMDKLTGYYKALHNDSDAGLPQLIANVTSTPLMLPGQEPAPAPTTPATTTTGTDGNGAKPASTPTPASKPPLSKGTPAGGRTTSGH